MTSTPTLPPVSALTVAESLSLRALGLLGIALPAAEDGTISATTLNTAEEYLLARQHEDSWLCAFLTEGAWRFTRRQLTAQAKPRFSKKELQAQNPPPPLPWIWKEQDKIVLRVNSVRDSITHTPMAWQFQTSDKSLWLAAEKAIVDYHQQVAFTDLPEDAKACAAYGFAAHLALPITGSRSLHDTLKREQLRQSQQLRRLRMSEAKPQVALKAGAYLQAFNGGGTNNA